MSAIPSTPSTAATIRTDPGANAPTTPSLDTVAVPSFEDRHVTVRSVSGLPVRSSTAAVSRTVRPMPRVARPGDTRTAATGTVTRSTPTPHLLPEPSGHCDSAAWHANQTKRRAMLTAEPRRYGARRTPAPPR